MMKRGSTTDVDKLNSVVRYLSENRNIMKIFLTYFPIETHDAEYLEDTALPTLQTFSLGIKYCFCILSLNIPETI